MTISNTGTNYLVAIDRYSTLEKAKDGAKILIKCSRHTLSTFGIPEESSSDGRKEYLADIFTELRNVP